ncbi:MAG: hypothetical protein ACE5FI_14090 [Anaerolineales bacterium]
MDEQQVALLLERYMRAAISLRIGAPANGWPLGLVEDAYDLLPPPAMDFEAWAARRGTMRDGRQMAPWRG